MNKKNTMMDKIDKSGNVRKKNNLMFSSYTQN